MACVSVRWHGLLAGDAGGVTGWLALVVSLVSLLLTYRMYRRSHPWVSWTVEYADKRFLLRNVGLSGARAVRVSGRNVAVWEDGKTIPAGSAEPFSFGQPPVPAQVVVEWRGRVWRRSCHVPMPPEHVDDPDTPDGGYDPLASIW